MVVSNGLIEYLAVDQKEIKETTADALLAHL